MVKANHPWTTAAVIFIAVVQDYSAASAALATRSIASARYSGACAPEIGDIRRPEDEAGHFLYTGLFGGSRLALDVRDILIAFQGCTKILWIEADIGSGLHQHSGLVRSAPSVKIQIHQPLFHLGRFADALPAQRISRCASSVLGRRP